MPPGVTAVLSVGPEVDRWLPTVASLRAAGIARVIAVTSAPDASIALGQQVEVIPGRSVAESFARLRNERDEIFAFVTAPVVVPVGVFDRALNFILDDMRIGCVCFLSNAGGSLSFPHRNKPRHNPVEGHDEQTLTVRLRETSPECGPVPIAIASGALTLVPRHVLDSAGPLICAVEGGDAYAVAELSLRMARRGFRTVLDSSTYVTRPWDPGQYVEPTEDRALRNRLHRTHAWFPTLHDAESKSTDSPVGLAISAALAKIQGLRITFDGSCLGNREMGTQVQTVALAGALADHPDVRSMFIGLPPGGKVPPYARALFARDKVEGGPAPKLRFPEGAHADILHRPFQPSEPIPWTHWRSVASRVVITLQDLIAFDNGAYHLTGEDWMRYRRTLQDAATRADGIVVISEDVAKSVHDQALDVPRDQLWTVYNGTNHLDSAAEEAIPREFAQRGLAAAPFIVVLGAAYAHKNRDLAIRAWQLLRDQGYPHSLVLVGVTVAQGSSRIEEARALMQGSGPVMLPEVASTERTWLLRHAAVVLYPTSAEGFGLVPFEAAALGTPTVVVPFGPIGEVLPQLPVTARGWDPAELARATARLINEPTLAAHQIAAVHSHGENMTWAGAADRLVDVYRRLLARPRRGSGQIMARTGAKQG